MGPSSEFPVNPIPRISAFCLDEPIPNNGKGTGMNEIEEINQTIAEDLKTLIKLAQEIADKLATINDRRARQAGVESHDLADQASYLYHRSDQEQHVADEFRTNNPLVGHDTAEDDASDRDTVDHGTTPESDRMETIAEKDRDKADNTWDTAQRRDNEEKQLIDNGVEPQAALAAKLADTQHSTPVGSTIGHAPIASNRHAPGRGFNKLRGRTR
jgi:hypothetical protein